MFAEHYLVIKHIHISLALLSGALFVLRGIRVLAVSGQTALQRRINRLSYIVDSGLLLAALLLLVSLDFAPLAAAWLQVKLLLLVLYVLFGVLAFRVKYTMPVRYLAFVAALICYAGMYYSARLHQPLAGLFS
ncbi:MAG TPA: SirB2 family protein [Thiopseudomonas sp.]|nr:SirB2 family protein [Thiopseudomonas sp.]